MKTEDLLEELNFLLVLISEDEVEKDLVGQETIDELRERISTLILGIRKEGLE